MLWPACTHLLGCDPQRLTGIGEILHISTGKKVPALYPVTCIYDLCFFVPVLFHTLPKLHMNTERERERQREREIHTGEPSGRGGARLCYSGLVCWVLRERERERVQNKPNFFDTHYQHYHNRNTHPNALPTPHKQPYSHWQWYTYITCDHRGRRLQMWHRWSAPYIYTLYASLTSTYYPNPTWNTTHLQRPFQKRTGNSGTPFTSLDNVSIFWWHVNGIVKLRLGRRIYSSYGH